MKKLFTLILLLGCIFRASAQTNSPVIAQAKSPVIIQPNSPIMNMLKADAGKLKLDSIQKADSIKKALETAAPLGYADFTWLNGNNRQTSKLLDNNWFTGDFTFDMNYTRSSNNPNDDMVTGSTALSRNNEVGVSMVAVGGDFHYDHVRGRLMTQFGTRATVVPRNDYSGYKGLYDLPDAYRYLSEAYGGYHFDTWHGINVDMGIFMSYIGLFSYNNFENWAYQPSYTSDNTPWFFNGIRVQMFPSIYTKVELWLINGWQSYGTFNKMPGLGGALNYQPNQRTKFISNNYFGTDVAGAPGVKRYHTDNSFQYLYYDGSDGKDNKGPGIKRMAFSVTADFGVQNGTAPGGIVYSPFGKNASNFMSAMVYNRTWFGDGMKWGWTFGGGVMSNPSRYLALVPPGLATDSFLAASVPGAKMAGWDASTTLDYSPNQNMTLRFEVVHRFMNIPYFNGPGGVTTGPGGNGYQTNPSTSYNPNSYIPNPPMITNAQGQSVPNPNFIPFDLVNAESRVILALIVRF